MLYDPRMHDRRKDLPVANRTLLQAADLLRERGWLQGSGSNVAGQVCMEMAIGIAADANCWKPGYDERVQKDILRDSLFKTALHLLAKHIEVESKWNSVSVATWNDAKGRTKEEVIEALETAAWSER
jgi:hypothetical protein